MNIKQNFKDEVCMLGEKWNSILINYNGSQKDTRSGSEGNNALETTKETQSTGVPAKNVLER